jgi:hypothetical protein
MATEPAMTPQDALTALSSVQGYRERLTAQAAGIVWMVWGLVISLAGMVAMVTTAQMLDGEKEVAIVLWGLAIAGGALLTNAVLRMQALESRGPAAWIPYAMGAGLLGAVIALDAGLSELIHLFGVGRTHHLGFASFNLLPAAGAFAIAFLQRHRVDPTKGYAAGAAFLGLYAIAALSASGVPAFFWSSLWVGLALAGYLALGAHIWTRG